MEVTSWLESIIGKDGPYVEHIDWPRQWPWVLVYLVVMGAIVYYMIDATAEKEPETALLTARGASRSNPLDAEPGEL